MTCASGDSGARLPSSWLSLWRELAERQQRARQQDDPAGSDPWRRRAREFDASVRRRLSGPDTLRDLIVSRLDATSTVLDVGAGPGGWAIPIARVARRVTCVEPSAAMLERLAGNLRDASVGNVAVLSSTWPCAVEPHDVVLCSHAMYSTPDFAAFTRALVASARREVYLVMRLPTMDGLMAEASRMVWGHPHDSPNLVVAFNALLEMGIYADVVVQRDLWRSWSSESIDAALTDLKRRLGVQDRLDLDAPLGDLLRRRLALVEGRYVWPAGVRSAMLRWSVAC